MNVLHIASRQAWVDARGRGRYISPSLATEGFIHCSRADQVLQVATKFYNGQTGLVLLVIDPVRLTANLRWEPPVDGQSPPGVPEGETFPHLYGPINLEAVVQVLDFEPGAAGNFALPAALDPGV